MDERVYWRHEYSDPVPGMFVEVAEAPDPTRVLCRMHGNVWRADLEADQVRALRDALDAWLATSHEPRPLPELPADEAKALTMLASDYDFRWELWGDTLELTHGEHCWNGKLWTSHDALERLCRRELAQQIVCFPPTLRWYKVTDAGRRVAAALGLRPGPAS